MIKKVKVEQLKPGMYIHDLNCSWLKHPFFGNSVKINDEKIIEKINDYGVSEVYIDTDLGLDVVDAPTGEEVGQEIQEELKEEELKEVDEKKPKLGYVVSIDKEIINARRIKQETVQTIQKIMSNVKLGKQIERGRVEYLVDNIIDSIFRNQDALIGLGRLRKINDYVYNHSMSVCVLMISFCRQLGFDAELIREIGIGAMLHDIGTTKVHSHILNKKTALSEEEYEKIKKHVEYGHTLLEGTEGVSNTTIITAYQHHERLDGSGYPNGLRGDEITQYGQAIAIVDVYDALTTKRCYKRKIPPTQALRMLYERSGVQFNKNLVQQFIRCIGIYPVGSMVRLESGLLGIVISHNEGSLLKPVVRVIYDTKKESNIVPYDVDLSKTSGKGGADRIINYESPEKWEIQPEVYL